MNIAMLNRKSNRFVFKTTLLNCVLFTNHNHPAIETLSTTLISTVSIDRQKQLGEQTTTESITEAKFRSKYIDTYGLPGSEMSKPPIQYTVLASLKY